MIVLLSASGEASYQISFWYIALSSPGWTHRYFSVCRWVLWLKQVINVGKSAPKVTL
jgi:hypothetical protein